MWSHEERGACVLWGSTFPLGMGDRETTPIAFTLSLSLVSHWCCLEGRTCLLRLQSLELTWGSGFEWEPWEVLSCPRAAIFGFQILILKQFPFDSSLLIAQIQDKFCHVSVTELGVHDCLRALYLCIRVLGTQVLHAAG